MGCVHRHSSSSPEPAYVSVGCTLHACPATHPCPWTFISVLRSGWFDFAIWAPWHIHPMPANLSRVPGSVRACGRRLSHPASSFKKTKISLELPAKMLSWREKKTDAWARRHGKRGSSKHAGIGQPEDSCRPQARTLTGVQAAVAWRDIGLPRTSARVLAIGIAQVRSWREGGSAVSAR